MSVVSIKEIHDGRDGQMEVRKGKNVRTYTRVWRAVTDNPNDNGAIVQAAAPAYMTPFPYDFTATLQRLSVRNESFSKRVWIVTGSYSTELEQPEGGPSENPLADPARIRWSTQQFSRPFRKDRDGKAILNSAGDPLSELIEDDDSRVLIVVRKNYAGPKAWLYQYRNAVNSDAVTVDGEGFAVGQLKIMGIDVGEWQSRNDIWFRELEISIAADEDGWDREYLDQGFRRIDPDDATKRIDIPDANGKKVTTPVLLDGEGAPLANPSLDNAVFLKAKIPKRKAFAGLPLR